jgi:hypothetical protein
MVRLYRIENSTIPAKPDGETSHRDLIGQWFTTDLDAGSRYIRKSTQAKPTKSGEGMAVVDGAWFVVQEVPVDELDSLHVSKHPIASGMDVERHNYIIPPDATYTTYYYPLDETIGELRGGLNNWGNLTEATRRIAKVAQDLGEVILR